MANNQEKYHEPIFFKKRNMISYLFLRNPKIFVIFARKVQYFCPRRHSILAKLTTSTTTKKPAVSHIAI